MLRGDVIAETSDGFLISAEFGSDNYLIIPDGHAESLQDLPDTWWQDFKALLAKLPVQPESYNLSLNMGKTAGQSVKHLHFWIIPRKDGQPASGKGLALLINEANAQ